MEKTNADFNVREEGSKLSDFDKTKAGIRLTITELADKVGVTPKTIIRWEKAGKIRKPKRDWKGWRIYLDEDIADVQRIVSAVYEI